MKQLSDYVLVIEDAISNDLCDLILKEYKNSDLWGKAKVSTSSPEIDGSYERNCDVLSLSSSHGLSGNREKQREILDKRLFNEVVTKSLDTYLRKFPRCEVSRDTGYDLLRYAEGQYLRPHVDYMKGENRVLSLSIALNDNFQGGEFIFFKGSLKIPLNKGCALLFPSNFMYDHEVTVVTQGTRYSILTWFV